MDLSTSCSTHCHVILNARTTLNVIRMIYFSRYAHCWSQSELDLTFGLPSSCPISGVSRISMNMPKHYYLFSELDRRSYHDLAAK
jgi:hypothetical protein